MKKVNISKILTSGAVVAVLATPAMGMAETVDGGLNTDQSSEVVEVPTVAVDDDAVVENEANEPTTTEVVADDVVENDDSTILVENSDVDVPQELPVVEDATVEAETLEEPVVEDATEPVASDTTTEEPEVVENSNELPATGSDVVVENEAPAPAEVQTTGWVLIDDNTYQVVVSGEDFKYNFADVPWCGWENYSILLEGVGTYASITQPESTEPDENGFIDGPIGNATEVWEGHDYFTDVSEYNERWSFALHPQEGQTLTLTVKNLDSTEVVDPAPVEPEVPSEPETPEVPTVEEPKDTDTSGESEAPVVVDDKKDSGKNNSGFGDVGSSIKDKATPKNEAPKVAQSEDSTIKESNATDNDVPKTGANLIGGFSSIVASTIAFMGILIKRRG